MTAPTRKTAVALAAAVASLALCATACGGSSGTSDSASAGKPVQLTYWTWTKNAQQVVDAFNKTHQDVHVKYVLEAGGAPGYAKVMAAVKAGNGPDVFNVEYSELPQFVSQGYVQDISSYVGSSVTSQFTPGAVSLTKLGGKNWAVPIDIEPEMLYYRKDLFAKYHLTVPTTWAQFRSTAQALKKADPKAVLTNFNTDDPTVAALAAQAGARWFGTSGDTWKVDFDDTGTRKVAAYWQGLIDDHLVSALPSVSPSVQANQAGGVQVALIDPPYQAAYNPSTLPKQSGDWAVAPLPTWDGTASTGALGGSTSAVSKNSKHAAAAAQFATWIATDAAAVKARVAGGASSALPAVPKLVDVAQQAFDSSYYGDQDLYTAFKAAAASLKTDWVWGPTMVSTTSHLTDGLNKVADGGTVAAALKSAQSKTAADMKAAGLTVSSAN
ncbi:ABC transporter substrate-binding protein [Streptomyces sp. CA2R106]|uniref:ABC transporter substrate-binding protein n=1 Tax=Streptomyces sp. CA2R106 TaxID=3120153 RepID=UPI00300B0519